MALTPVALSLAGVAASVAKNAAIAVAVFAVGKFCYHPDSPFQIVQEAKKALQDGTLLNYLAKVDADGLARGLAGEWDQTLCEAILRICDASVAGSILARIIDSDFLKSNPDSATDVLDLFNDAERLPVLIEVLKQGSVDLDNLVDENGEDRFGVLPFVAEALSIEFNARASYEADPNLNHFTEADHAYEKLLQEVASQPPPKPPPQGIRV